MVNRSIDGILPTNQSEAILNLRNIRRVKEHNVRLVVEDWFDIWAREAADSRAREVLVKEIMRVV